MTSTVFNSNRLNERTPGAQDIVCCSPCGCKKYALFLFFFCVTFLAVTSAHTQTMFVPSLTERAPFHHEKATLLIQERRYEEAIVELDKAYQYSFSMRERNMILMEKAIALMELGENGAALLTIEEREFDFEREGEFLFLKATCLQELGRIAPAIALLDTLIIQEKNLKNKTSLLIKEGMVFLSLDSLAAAARKFDSVLSLLDELGEPADSIEREKTRLTHYALGFIALRTGKHQQAKQHFAALGRLHADDEVEFKSKLYILLIQGLEQEEIDSLMMPESFEGKERSEVAVLAGYLCYRYGSYGKAKAAFSIVEGDAALDAEIRAMTMLLSAECSYMLRAYDDAITKYNEYIKMVTTAEEKKAALYGLSWSYYRSGQYSNAYAVTKDFFVLYPDSPLLKQMEWVAALSLFYVGEHARAKYHFSRLLGIVPALKEKDRIYYLRGKSKFYLGEYEQALDDFNTVITRYQNSRWRAHAMNLVAQIYFKRGAYQDAHALYRDLLDMDLSMSLLDEVRLQSERCLLHLGYYRNPIEMSKGFVRKYPQSPKSPDLLLEVGEYYFQMQRYWDAIREYERFLALFGKDESFRFVQFRLAQSYALMEYREKAIDKFTILSMGEDEYAESSLVAMGDLLYNAKQFKESIQALRSLTSRFSESRKKDYANFLIGKNYLELNLPKEARMSLESAVKSKRDFSLRPEAHLLIAQTLYMEGRGEEYLAYLDGLIASGMGTIHANAYFLKAAYKKETGRLKVAMELYEQAAFAFEGISDKVLALYEAGLAAEELMLMGDAVDYYTQAIGVSQIESEKYGIKERIERIRMIEGR